MFFSNVNFIVVVVAAIASMVVGFIWYSPWVLGKQFMSLMAYGPEESARKAKNMWRSYVTTFITSLVMAYILSVLINSLFVSGVYGLMIAGLSVVVGFIVPVKINDVIFGHDSWTLFFINVGYQAISVVVMSVVIGLFS